MKYLSQGMLDERRRQEQAQQAQQTQQAQQAQQTQPASSTASSTATVPLSEQALEVVRQGAQPVGGDGGEVEVEQPQQQQQQQQQGACCRVERRGSEFVAVWGTKPRVRGGRLPFCWPSFLSACLPAYLGPPAACTRACSLRAETLAFPGAVMASGRSPATQLLPGGRVGEG